MQRPTKLAIIDDELFDAHLPDSDLPEKPRRTQGIRGALKALGETLPAVWLVPEPIAREDLERVHNPRYVSEVFVRCEKLETGDDGQMLWISNDHEVLVSRGSLNAILHAAGAAQQAVWLAVSPQTPIRRVFCNVRPPGHHAHAGKGQGFCIFNNIWIAACAARQFGARRVAIVDWDVHHGNGTQDFIIGHPDEADTLFFSIHQHHKTLWPGSGKEETRGHYGTVRCGEMQPGSGDDEMKRYFADVLLPKLNEFKPEIVLISCGFDGHVQDHIAGLHYSSELYGWMTERLVEVAERWCGGRIVSMLEGGYCVPALRESAIHHVRALI